MPQQQFRTFRWIELAILGVPEAFDLAIALDTEYFFDFIGDSMSATGRIDKVGPELEKFGTLVVQRCHLSHTESCKLTIHKWQIVGRLHGGLHDLIAKLNIYESLDQLTLSLYQLHITQYGGDHAPSEGVWDGCVISVRESSDLFIVLGISSYGVDQICKDLIATTQSSLAADGLADGSQHRLYRDVTGDIFEDIPESSKRHFNQIIVHVAERGLNMFVVKDEVHQTFHSWM